MQRVHAASDHTQGQTHTHKHTLSRTPLEDGSVRRRDFWQHTTLTKDTHASRGIRTQNPSNRETADPRLRPRSFSSVSTGSFNLSHFEQCTWIDGNLKRNRLIPFNINKQKTFYVRNTHWIYSEELEEVDHLEDLVAHGCIPFNRTACEGSKLDEFHEIRIQLKSSCEHSNELT